MWKARCRPQPVESKVRSGAARRLGVNPHTLRGRMRRLGITWKAYRRPRTGDASAGAAPAGAAPAGDAPATPGTSGPPGFDAAMHAHIEAALAASYGRIEGPLGAAARLRINPHTLRARMRKLGIDRQKFRMPAGGRVVLSGRE